MAPVARRLLFIFVIASIFVYTGYQYGLASPDRRYRSFKKAGKLRWIDVKEHFPVEKKLMYTVPKPLNNVPKVQFDFSTITETAEEKTVREVRLALIRGNMSHAWSGYKTQAWLKDEVKPVTGGPTSIFGGWAATLVDSLDTLWIMGFHAEFDEAVAATELIDFTTSSQQTINVFETTIRHLGGFLAAYDLSGKEELLYKAVELGDMLYKAFDTPNRMPVTRWSHQDAYEGNEQVASSATLLAEIGSLSLEFTRLSQLTGDPKWYDAINRITDHFYHQKNDTKMPGMFPIMVDAGAAIFTDDITFSLGAMADSFYEYLPKMYALLGGAGPEYKALYEGTIKAAKENLFFKPYNENNMDILMSGTVHVTRGKLENDYVGQHLSCYIGGMVGLAAKVFGTEADDLKVARQLTDACIWAYEATPGSKVMPEIFHAIPCSQFEDNCDWSYNKWVEALHGNHASHHLKKDGRLTLGFYDVIDGRYLLRPEAIESVFILYRITGDKSLRESGWRMFESIIKATKTTYGHSAIDDVTTTSPGKLNNMESFWTAETLKYFYLLFANENVISLDDYVFNTEAHPLSRKIVPKNSWLGSWSK